MSEAIRGIVDAARGNLELSPARELQHAIGHFAAAREYLQQANGAQIDTQEAATHAALAEDAAATALSHVGKAHENIGSYAAAISEQAAAMPDRWLRTDRKRRRPHTPEEKAAYHTEAVATAASAREQLELLYSNGRQSPEYSAALKKLHEDVLCLLLREDTPGVAEELIGRYRGTLAKAAVTELGRQQARGLDEGDLWSVGAMELLRSCRNLNPGEAAVYTYALGNSVLAMKNEIAKNGHTVRIPEHVRERVREWKTEDDRRLSVGQAPMDNEELAAFFETGRTKAESTGAVTIAELRQARSVMDSLDSLSPPRDNRENDNGTPAGDPYNTAESDRSYIVASQRTPTPEEAFARKELLRVLNETLTGALSAEERQWVTLRYGLDGDSPMTKQEAMDAMGINSYKATKYDGSVIGKLSFYGNRQLIRLLGQGGIV